MGQGTADYWLLKINDTGLIQWEKCYGGTNNDQCEAMVVTSDSGFIMAGTSFSTDGQVTGNHGETDYWVVKVSSTGILQWQKALGGSSV